MDAAASAPLALVLSVSADAVATLSLVLMAYEGPLPSAMFPHTGDTRLDVATSLGDVLLLAVARGAVALLPLLFRVAASRPWLCAAVSSVTAMNGWLLAKAVLLYQLQPRATTFEVPGSGVTLLLPVLLAAEALGVLMGCFLVLLAWVFRKTLLQPAAGDPAIALQAALQQQRMAVQEWVLGAGGARAAAGAGLEGAGDEAGGGLTLPLLEGSSGGEIDGGRAGDGGGRAAAAFDAADAAAGAADAAEAGRAGVVGSDSASFVSARSRQLSLSSWPSGASGGLAAADAAHDSARAAGAAGAAGAAAPAGAV